MGVAYALSTVPSTASACGVELSECTELDREGGDAIFPLITLKKIPDSDTVGEGVGLAFNCSALMLRAREPFRDRASTAVVAGASTAVGRVFLSVIAITGADLAAAEEEEEDEPPSTSMQVAVEPVVELAVELAVALGLVADGAETDSPSKSMAEDSVATRLVDEAVVARDASESAMDARDAFDEAFAAADVMRDVVLVDGVIVAKDSLEAWEASEDSEMVADFVVAGGFGAPLDRRGVRRSFEGADADDAAAAGSGASTDGDGAL